MKKVQTMKKFDMTQMTHNDVHIWSTPPCIPFLCLSPLCIPFSMPPPPYVHNRGRLYFMLPVDVTHQTCLVLWTWRKLADETNAKNAPKIC